MTSSVKSRFVGAITATLACLILAIPPLSAQTLTTGSMSGTAVDQQGAVLPGVTISATHSQTGTRYDAITGGDGRFQLPNLRPGTYSVTATLSGFRDQTQDNMNVGLGEDKPVEFKLALATVSETVNVVAQAVFSDTVAGTASNVRRDAIESLPTIQRNIFDFARTSPLVNLSPDSANGQGFISVAGRNNRYNNMQIDGAVNNDLFGVGSTGTPGGTTGTQPISLDAIQEIQVVVAPYDVRQGGFSGGGVNAITRSGGNAFSGTGYLFGRNEGLVGKIPALPTSSNPSPADLKVGVFADKQGGASLGGPIMKNKAFFFGNVDFARKTTPVGFSISGNSGQPFGNTASAQQVLTILKTQYGFDPGSLDEVSMPNTSDKYFFRTDFNLMPGHLLTARVNYIDALANVNFPSSTTYYLPDEYYQIHDKNLGVVTQLNSTGSHLFNELRVAYQRIRDVRGDQPGFSHFPMVQVDFPDGTNARLGTDAPSQANDLHQDIVEVTNDLTFLKGKHTVTVGTHNEFFKFYDLFINGLWGNYRFSSVANLQAGLAQSYSTTFSKTSNPLEAPAFSVRQFGLYAGDVWRARSDLTITYGVRVDLPRFPDTPHANPLAVADFGYRTDVVPSPSMWSPRVGFNWDLSGGKSTRSQVRGGIGFFTGRTPYVWLTNQYGNTGVDFASISIGFNATNRIAFVADPLNQPKTVPGAATGNQTLNLIDPDYKFPEVIRGNLALDHELGIWGLVGTAELLFNKNVKDIDYKNLNYIPAGTAPDGRVLLKKLDSALNDVMLLTNTSKGMSTTIAFKVERPFRNGFNVSGSYAYNHATSLSDGTASQAGSNWANTPVAVYINDFPLTRSNFDVGHRVNATAVIPIRFGHGINSSAAFFYNGQSGRPYVLNFNGDVNGDTRTSNDIVFAPSDPSQVNVLNGTYAQLDAFLSADCGGKNPRGVILQRNSCRAPWWNSLDFRYAVTLPTGSRAKVELTMDVFNLLNLLNKDWGWVFFPPFPASGSGVIGYSGITGGKETFNLNTINSPTFTGLFQRDDLRSRWQAQWGLRVRF